MKSITLFRSNCKRNQQNAIYPYKCEINSSEQFFDCIAFDHVAAYYERNRRNISNFLLSDCLMLDCDNTHSDDPGTWRTPDDVSDAFQDVPFYFSYSKNHLKPKNGKEARPKFHVYFPIDPMSNANEYQSLKDKVIAVFPFFDIGAKDAARYFDATENGGGYIDGETFLNKAIDYLSPAEPIEIEQTKLISAVESFVLPEKIEKGKRNSTLFSYARSMRAKKVMPTDIWKNLVAANKQRCTTQLPKKEVENIFNYCLKVAEGKTTEQMQPPNTQPNEMKALRADSYTEEVHEFLWKPYIPLKDFTILMASSGTGKSYFSCKLAAQISKGERLYLDTDIDKKPKPENVLYISSEENGNELYSRMKACKADMTKIFILDRKTSVGMSFDSSGYNDFIYQIKQCSPKLVIIDPWQSYIGSEVDVNRINQVRPLLQSLANMALECNCAILLISHVNKRSQSENINNSAIGSSEFVNASRSAMMIVFSDNEEEKDVRIVVHSKQNYTSAGESLKYRITAENGVEWIGRSDVTRQVLEDAARYHKKTGEILSEATIKRDRETDLINAILNEMSIREGNNCKKMKSISYTEFRELYGDDIFGGGQPKKLLTVVAYKLKEQGVNLVLDKLIKVTDENGKTTTTRGFQAFKV